VKETEIQARVEGAVLACLGDVPGLKVKRVRTNQRMGDMKAGLLVDVQIGEEQPRQLVVETKANGQPRLARDAANQLLRWLTMRPDAYGVFLAPYISPQSAEICSKAGIGYLDLAGNCRLSFGKVYIRREGNRNPFVQKRDLQSLYASKSSRVLRVLLMRGMTWWKTQPLAAEAGVSFGKVANVRSQLRNREWIAEGKGGFRLSAPQALLTEWSENYTFRKNEVRNFYTIKGTDEVEKTLSDACRDLGIAYAFTGFSASRRIAPAVRGQRVMAYVGAMSEALLERIGLKEVPSGANVSLMIPYDEGVFYGAGEVEALRVVCPVQLYLDLKGYKGRGDEAAEAVWKQELSKLW
jgi:hypothetical protein